MYGFINSRVQSLVIEKFGEETREQLTASADVQDAFMTYTACDDIITIKLIQEGGRMSGYDRMLWTLGGNLTEFIENLDALHSYLTLSYQEMNGPSFHTERGADGKMLLRYYFDRSGLHHIVPDIIEAVAKDFFNFEVTMDILDISKEEERTGKKEHVVFLIVQKSPRRMRRAKPNRSQDSQDIQRDQEALEAAFLRMKEKYLSVTVCPVKKSCWEVVRSTVMFGKGHLMNTFVPIYPKQLWIEEKTFCNAFFPHILFDESMTWMELTRCMRYTCSPKLHGLQELEERKMRLSDIAPHDTTRDLILPNQQRLAEIELSSQLERKKEELWILSKHLAVEKKKAETLLYAMLPEQVANQLKEGKKVAAEASAQESQDSTPVAVMRYADSRQLLPKSDAADGEYTSPVTKTPSAALHVKRISGFRASDESTPEGSPVAGQGAHGGC